MVSTSTHRHLMAAASATLLLTGGVALDPPAPTASPAPAAPAAATCEVRAASAPGASTADRYQRSIVLGPRYHWAE